MHGLVRPFHYGRAYQQAITLPNHTLPGPQARVIPAEASERVLCVNVNVLTNAVASNRTVMWAVLDEDGNYYYSCLAPTQIVASSGVSVIYMVGSPQQTPLSNNQQAWLPDVILPPSWTWQVMLLNGQTGDQIYSTTAVVERYPNSQVGYEIGVTSERTPDILTPTLGS